MAEVLKDATMKMNLIWSEVGWTKNCLPLKTCRENARNKDGYNGKYIFDWIHFSMASFLKAFCHRDNGSFYFDVYWQVCEKSSIQIEGMSVHSGQPH